MSNKIIHHPDSATLMAYAAATLPEALAAVVASHVSMCAQCRAEVVDMELIGAALFHDIPAVSDTETVSHARMSLPQDGYSSGVATLERPAVTAPAARSIDALPAPIAAVYGLSLDTIPWRRLAPGIWHYRLALREPGAGDLRLLKVAPGRALPDHGHGGSELTLVLKGSYSDVTGAYHHGDVQDVDESVEHQPIVGDDGYCICLIASERPAQFKSRLGRLLQPLTGM